MKATKSHVHVMRSKYEQNAKLILECTGVHDQDYNSMQFDYASDYIRHKVLNDDDVVSKITSQQEFWIWWVNQWNIREDAFITNYLEFVLAGGFESFLNPEWQKLHDVANIKALLPEPVLKRAVQAIEDEQRKEAGNA